ncbi:MAG: arginine deiminase-related protein [Chitinophagaceae bacterium]
MIRPVNFGFNAETAVNNAFQVPGQDENAQENALKEFDQFVSKLRQNDVNVIVVNDTPEPFTPDSIFPNNWISFHEDGTLIYYPMFAVNRRLERKQNVIDTIRDQFEIKSQLDLSSYEAKDVFLEGTGSMVLDRENKIAYACLSPRTDKAVLNDFCKQTGYKPVSFRAVDGNGKEIYHTNVMMCVADKYVVICLDSINDEAQRNTVADTIKKTGKEIIAISLDQMNHFAGNMLQVQNVNGEKLLVMSSQAFESLTAEQINRLNGYNRIIHSSLTTIETNGGGSARCMMAEVHLGVKNLLAGRQGKN